MEPGRRPGFVIRAKNAWARTPFSVLFAIPNRLQRWLKKSKRGSKAVPQGLKLNVFLIACGATEVAPFQRKSRISSFSEKCSAGGESASST
jgi:hypothetical protein